MLSTASKEVQRFTDRLIREYPALDAEEVQGAFWVAAARTIRFWKQGGGEKFSTSLFRDLTWERGKIIRQLVKDCQVASICAPVGVVDPIEPGLEDKWNRLLQELREEERQVLELMVQPSSMFLHYVNQSWRDRKLRYPSKKSGSTVQHIHYARFLGLSPMKITRIIRRIQQVAQEVFHDER